MEAERQLYGQQLHVTESGKVVVGPDQKIGSLEKFEFGVPGDAMSLVIGGGYISHWNPDFLQRDMGKEGTCARYYYERRVIVDIADPESLPSRRKRKLLFRHGFAYLCIPPNFPQDENRLRRLYRAALDEYYQYEALHPRPAVLQETTIVDANGSVRRAMVTAIDLKVGGGMIGSVEQQIQELRKGAKLSKKQIRMVKLRTKLHRKLRRVAQDGIPFRNPFIAKGKRQFPVQYQA